MKRYLSLLVHFLKISLIADFQFRVNLAVKILTDLIWYAAQISVFEVIYGQTQTLGGWDIHQTRVFLGVLYTVDAIFSLLISENLDHLSDKVRKGDLDLILAKPINSQFMISFQKMSTPYIFNLILSLSWLTWAYLRLNPEPNPLQLAWLIVLLPIGCTIFYSLKFFFSASALILSRAENLSYTFYQFYKLGTRPDRIYPPWLRFILLSIIPVSLIASMPARVVLEADQWTQVFGSAFVAAIFLYLSNRYWKYGLRQYSSASS